MTAAAALHAAYKQALAEQRAYFSAFGFTDPTVTDSPQRLLERNPHLAKLLAAWVAEQDALAAPVTPPQPDREDAE